MLPQEMASAVNLFAHPAAGAAAMSALGFGLASHAFGLWAGALSGAGRGLAAAVSPLDDEFGSEPVASSQPRSPPPRPSRRRRC